MAHAAIPLPVVYEPAAQLVQTVKGVNEYWPGVHRVQAPIPVVAATDPAVQVAHTDTRLLPVAPLYLPVPQAVQVVLPAWLWYVPVPQESQVSLPSMLAYLPSTQAGHTS